MFKTIKNIPNVSIDLNIIVLIKMEILKFILFYNIYFKENKTTHKQLHKSLHKSLNFCLNLKFYSEEIKILEKNSNNKFFTYNILRNNKVFRETLKKFIKNPQKRISILDKKSESNLINKIRTLDITFKKYNIFYKHLQTIKDNYNMILNTKTIYAELEYRKILDFYLKTFKEKKTITKILKEDLSIYYISNFTLKKENYNSVEKNIEVLNNLHSMNKITNIYINAEPELKEDLINNLNILNDKIL